MLLLSFLYIQFHKRFLFNFALHTFFYLYEFILLQIFFEVFPKMQPELPKKRRQSQGYEAISSK